MKRFREGWEGTLLQRMYSFGDGEQSDAQPRGVEDSAFVASDLNDVDMC